MDPARYWGQAWVTASHGSAANEKRARWEDGEILVSSAAMAMRYNVLSDAEPPGGGMSVVWSILGGSLSWSGYERPSLSSSCWW